MYFSVVIPVYNRPDELYEVLSSLVSQSFKDFEVIVIDDGSTISSRTVIEQFQNSLNLTYLSLPNQGQGFARNDGMKAAKGSFFIILDSDVSLPLTYLEVLKKAIHERNLDAFGGPDAASDHFGSVQKAMDFAMTSFWTTGGIRGKLKDASKFQARGFNMGVSKTVFETTGGFLDPNKGEDIEWSIRIKKAGYKLELVEEAFVYHKRKSTLKAFAKQAFSFGRNRVNVSRYHPEAIKAVHLLPSFFLLFSVGTLISGVLKLEIFPFLVSLLAIWSIAVLVSSTNKYKSLLVGFYSLITSFTQLWSYGLGLLVELVKKLLKG